MKRTKLADRELPVYTKGEEIANMVTHIIGAVMGVVAIVLCSIKGRKCLWGDWRNYFWYINGYFIYHV